jgi:hypothetical protein
METEGINTLQSDSQIIKSFVRQNDWSI